MNPPGAGVLLVLPQPHRTPKAEKGSTGPAQPHQDPGPTAQKESCTSGWVARGEHAGRRTGRVKARLNSCPISLLSLGGLAPIYQEKLVRNTVCFNCCPWRAQGPGASPGFTATLQSNSKFCLFSANVFFLIKVSCPFSPGVNASVFLIWSRTFKQVLDKIS